eukprot:7378538-Prymnesium_polylepis.2
MPPARFTQALSGELGADEVATGAEVSTAASSAPTSPQVGRHRTHALATRPRTHAHSRSGRARCAPPPASAGARSGGCDGCVG